MDGDGDGDGGGGVLSIGIVIMTEVRKVCLLHRYER